MFRQPVFDPGMFVRGVVVTDQMQILVFRGFPVDLTQELEPLAVAMLGRALTDHRAVQHIERGKQSCLAVAFVSIGHGRCAAFFSGATPAGFDPAPGSSFFRNLHPDNARFLELSLSFADRHHWQFNRSLAQLIPSCIFKNL